MEDKFPEFCIRCGFEHPTLRFYPDSGTPDYIECLPIAAKVRTCSRCGGPGYFDYADGPLDETVLIFICKGCEDDDGFEMLCTCKIDFPSIISPTALGGRRSYLPIDEMKRLMIIPRCSGKVGINSLPSVKSSGAQVLIGKPLDMDGEEMKKIKELGNARARK